MQLIDKSGVRSVIGNESAGFLFMARAYTSGVIDFDKLNIYKRSHAAVLSATQLNQRVYRI